MNRVMLSIVAISSMICATGCIRPTLQPCMPVAETPAPERPRLGTKADAVATAEDSANLAADAWNWISTEVSDTYHNSSMGQCYEKDKDNVHSLSDAKALALKCWNEN